MPVADDMESFVISMDSDTGKARRERFYRECVYAGIHQPTWVKGVKFSPDTMKQHSALLSPLCRHTCSPGAIGCGLAHFSIYLTCSSSDESVLVFEDDCVLANGFQHRLGEAIDSVPSDFDVLFLGCQSSCGDPRGKSGVHRVDDTHGTHAYVISATGRKKMLETGLLDHIDMQIGAMAKQGILQVYYCWPDIASASTTDMADSMISPPTGFPNSLTSLLGTMYNEKGLPISRHYTGEMRRVGPVGGISVGLTNWHFILFIIGIVAGFRSFIWLLFALDIALFPGDTWNSANTIAMYVIGAILHSVILSV